MPVCVLVRSHIRHKDIEYEGSRCIFTSYTLYCVTLKTHLNRLSTMNLKPLIARCVHTCCAMACVFAFNTSAWSQLKADFSVDKTGGCSPLHVSFTNKSTGTSPNTIYHWDFGNGNTSTLPDPGAIFTEEKSYTVTLTVAEGNQTSVKTQLIDVYYKPTVDFSAGVVKGCIPLNVNFASNSSAGSGEIASYHWDFGDGTTQQSFGNTIDHSYTTEQLATVSLTVTNTYGCHSTLVKKDIVEVKPRLTASFDADKTVLCRESDPVQFTNTSNGPGTLSYQWDFGDGTTSTEKNPSHVFNKRGTYTVMLTVTSSDGCIATSRQSGYINVANFKTDFTIPGQICSETYQTFNSTTTPAPNTVMWQVNDELAVWYSYSLTHFFPTNGNYKVKLTADYGGCIDSAVKTFTVKQSPASNGFIATAKGECGAPVQVDFRDTTPNAVSWQWNFDYGFTNQGSSTLQAPSYTFNQNRSYSVQLKVTNSEGCTKELVRSVGFVLPYVIVGCNIISEHQSHESCEPISAKFFVNSTNQPITEYRWEFGDGTISTEAEPEHTFSRPGTYQIVLHYKTLAGCAGTSYYNSITVREKPQADFKSVTGTTICGSVPVIFSNTSGGDYYFVQWFIDGEPVGGSYGSMEYRFTEEGQYTIKLIANNGFCSDTMEKVNYITVKPPFPRIDAIANSCEGNRGDVTITNGSRQGETYTWDFGDGTSFTTTDNPSTLTHSYTQTGQYKVSVTATNGSCTVRDSTYAYVMLRKQPELSMAAVSCVDAPYQFTISNLQSNPWPDYNNYDYFIAKWEYDDGTPYTGYMNSYPYIGSANSYTGSIQAPDHTRQRMRVIIQSIGFGCYDTTGFVPVKVVGPVPAVEIVDNNVCFNSPVTFKDVGTTIGGTNIVTRRWSFGDGGSLHHTDATVTHVYKDPGTYYVWLSVTDDNGCTATTAQYTNTVTVNGPLAKFTASGTNVPLNTDVQFYNSTFNAGDYNTTYEWDFGDGATSTAYSPSHTYTSTGVYTVRLRASNAVTGCSSEATETIIVRQFNTAFNFSKTYITSQSCPPVVVRFINTSVGYIRLKWDFGDGIVANNVANPSHIYEKPGKYIVTLYGYGPNGLEGTHIDSILVEAPIASLFADDLEACVGSTITLFAKADSVQSYIWDFGDGTVITTTDTFFAHQYNVPGVYKPRLLTRNQAGCSSFASMNEQVSIRPNPLVNISPADPVVCLGRGTPLQASGGVSYSWSPATGLSNGNTATPTASPTTDTEYKVEVTDDIGCKNTGTVLVKVQSPLKVSLPADLSVCAGNSITLPAGGADIYNWINNTSGLSAVNIANPAATPSATTTYTVTGSDIHHCFTDTAEVTVRVLPLPVINAGPDAEVQAGTPVNLNPTYSPDVIQWTWSPAKYLDCSTCPAPVSTPLAPTEYTLTVKNSAGCIAKDSVLIKMICDEAKVAIPNAFTPNGDGKNDVFMIKGISVVKHLVIYNRWGQKVFEANNFIAADRSACWNGTLNGYPASPGTYVYYVEMECPSGGGFRRKGSFVLIR